MFPNEIVGVPDVSVILNPSFAWRDNLFIERSWRNFNYEEVYLRAYDSVSHARSSLDMYFDFYNTRRTHTSHGKRTPDEVYFNLRPMTKSR